MKLSKFIYFRMPRGLGWVRSPKTYVRNKVNYMFTFNLLRIFKSLFK